MLHVIVYSFLSKCTMCYMQTMLWEQGLSDMPVQYFLTTCVEDMCPPMSEIYIQAENEKNEKSPVLEQLLRKMGYQFKWTTITWHFSTVENILSTMPHKKCFETLIWRHYDKFTVQHLLTSNAKTITIASICHCSFLEQIHCNDSCTWFGTIWQFFGNMSPSMTQLIFVTWLSSTDELNLAIFLAHQLPYIIASSKVPSPPSDLWVK